MRTEQGSESMFKLEQRKAYEADERYADSGSRPPIDTFVDGQSRERRFIPRGVLANGDLARWARIPYGVRQVRYVPGVGYAPAF